LHTVIALFNGEGFATLVILGATCTYRYLCFALGYHSLFNDEGCICHVAETAKRTGWKLGRGDCLTSLATGDSFPSATGSFVELVEVTLVVEAELGVPRATVVDVPEVLLVNTSSAFCTAFGDLSSIIVKAELIKETNTNAIVAKGEEVLRDVFGPLVVDGDRDAGVALGEIFGVIPILNTRGEVNASLATDTREDAVGCLLAAGRGRVFLVFWEAGLVGIEGVPHAELGSISIGAVGIGHAEVFKAFILAGGVVRVVRVLEKDLGSAIEVDSNGVTGLGIVVPCLLPGQVAAEELETEDGLDTTALGKAVACEAAAFTRPLDVATEGAKSGLVVAYIYGL